MTNKKTIKKLRDNAELACAAYGYFDLMTNENNDFFIKVKDDESKQDKDDNSSRKPISIQDILNITYKGYEVYKKPSPLPTLKPEKIGKLDGDFSSTQAKNFFKHYELLECYPHFDEKNNRQTKGFHSCLFKNRETQEFALTFSGTEQYGDYL